VEEMLCFWLPGCPALDTTSDRAPGRHARQFVFSPRPTKVIKIVCVLAVLLVLIVQVATACDEHFTVVPEDTVHFRFVQHPESLAELPRIALPDDPAVEQRVNRSLDSLAASLRCAEELPSAGTPYETYARVTHASDGVFSVHIRASYFCGGAYPVNGANMSVTYDLRTGRAPSVEDHFARYEDDQDAIIERLVTVLRQARSEDVEGDDASCDRIYSLEHMRYFDYHIDAGKLMVEPQLPRVVQACGIMTMVPIDELRSFLSEDSFLRYLDS
jgi:hypothetical protein